LVKWIYNPEAPGYDYQVFDLNGRLIGSGNNDIQEPINMYNFSTGTYIVTVVGETGLIGRFKIIKK
jgi:hypothetical protein